MKKLVISSAIVAALGFSGAYAASNNVGGGRVDFHGKVTDVSCTISVNGQGADNDIYLAPVTVTEVKSKAAHTYLKAKPFTIDVSNCLPIAGPSRAPGDYQPLDKLGVRWTGGNLLQNVNAGSMSYGYLANLEATGAQNIQLALSKNGNSLYGHKIVPGAPDQVIVNPDTTSIKDTARFVYYVGYATATPGIVTTGAVQSYATYEVIYD